MTPQYYAEEIAPNGQPVPVIYHGDKPAEKTTSGKKRRFHEKPKLIDPDHLGLSLVDLRELYGSGEGER